MPYPCSHFYFDIKFGVTKVDIKVKVTIWIGHKNPQTRNARAFLPLNISPVGSVSYFAKMILPLLEILGFCLKFLKICISVLMNSNSSFIT